MPIPPVWKDRSLLLIANPAPAPAVRCACCPPLAFWTAASQPACNLENKLPLIDDRRQTDRVTILTITSRRASQVVSTLLIDDGPLYHAERPHLSGYVDDTL